MKILFLLSAAFEKISDDTHIERVNGKIKICHNAKRLSKLIFNTNRYEPNELKINKKYTQKM